MKDHDLVERDGLEVNQPQTNRGRCSSGSFPLVICSDRGPTQREGRLALANISAN